MERLAPAPVNPGELLQWSNTPMVAAAAHLDAPAVFGPAHVWTWRQIHTASIELAARLNRAATLCNLSDSHLGFVVTWLAALRLGCPQLLPPSGGHAELVAILRSSENPCIVVDNGKTLQPHWARQARCVVNVPETSSNRIPDAELAWEPDWDSPLVHLYTSGSTGTPVAQVKTLGRLACGADLLGERLNQEVGGGLAGIRRIVSSVPPQHMFGLEASVMMSLMHGIPILERRPLLPADVRAAFEVCEDGAAWIATPLHLRGLERASQTVPHCSVVIASTMPLATTLAGTVEHLVEAPVLEIYGSTETGAIAMRRTARDAQWRPLRGVRLEPDVDGTLAWGAHFLSPQILADQIVSHGQGGFTLLGRQTDLIKVAGRRASLVSLNHALQELPGLVDGVFYLPSTGAPGERLVLIHSGEALERAATEAWLRERIDPAFLPRAIIRVSHLPRAGVGKLQRAALDEIYAAWLVTRRVR